MREQSGFLIKERSIKERIAIRVVEAGYERMIDSDGDSAIFAPLSSPVGWLYSCAQPAAIDCLPEAKFVTINAANRA